MLLALVVLLEITGWKTSFIDTTSEERWRKNGQFVSLHRNSISRITTESNKSTWKAVKICSTECSRRRTLTELVIVDEKSMELSNDFRIFLRIMSIWWLMTKDFVYCEKRSGKDMIEIVLSRLDNLSICRALYVVLTDVVLSRWRNCVENNFETHLEIWSLFWYHT